MKEAKLIASLVKRHVMVYFKDKSSFYLSLITPAILIVLYVTFLKNVYELTLLSIIPEGINISKEATSGFISGWLISSILSTCTITIAFCSNIIMVNDKINLTINDFLVTPIKKTTLQVSYIFANFINTFIVCMLSLGIGFVYMAISGWFLSGTDVLLIILTTILSITFGCLLVGIIEYFISTAGGASAISTLVSSMYGFICGAYMPISQFTTAIKTVMLFLPGTYLMILFRKFFMQGSIEKLGEALPEEVVISIQEGFDIKISFFGNDVTTMQCFLIIIATIVVLFIAYVLIIILSTKNMKAKKTQ